MIHSPEQILGSYEEFLAQFLPVEALQQVMEFVYLKHETISN